MNYQYELRTSGSAGSGLPVWYKQVSAIRQASPERPDYRNCLLFCVRTDCNAVPIPALWASKAYTVPTYVPITITSYNQDVVAEGVATALSTTTTAVDDATGSGNEGFAIIQHLPKPLHPTLLPTPFVASQRKNIEWSRIP